MDFNQVVNDFAAWQRRVTENVTPLRPQSEYEGNGGWADGRLGQAYDFLDVIGGSLTPGSTELGCLAEALKAIELADQYIEKRQRENGR